jgi:hypothetical protein
VARAAAACTQLHEPDVHIPLCVHAANAVQGLLLLAHPAIVISWITFGMWHGLMTGN